MGALPYGTWLSDFDGDGRLDAYSVNHGQDCHLSGLWLNGGAGAFGKNLWSVAVRSANGDGASLDLHQVKFVGDLTGDGRVDIYFLDWSSLGVMCVNAGNAPHADWSGPSFVCYQSRQPETFADVNGDGRIDVEVSDPSAPDKFVPQQPSPATDYVAPQQWRSEHQQVAHRFESLPLRGPGRAGRAARLQQGRLSRQRSGIEVPPAERGTYATSSGGLRVELGRPAGRIAW